MRTIVEAVPRPDIRKIADGSYGRARMWRRLRRSQTVLVTKRAKMVAASGLMLWSLLVVLLSGYRW
jgi:hypothetical protein